jgi:anti-anti-sigma regulatory factor
MSPFTIVAETHPADHSVTILLNGVFREESLPELEESIVRARQAQQRVFIDLSEVTLVDRKAVQYFANQSFEEVELINCPAYLRPWISPDGSESEKRS